MILAGYNGRAEQYKNSLPKKCNTRIKNFIFSNFGPTRGIQRSTYKRMKKTNKEDMTHFVI
jgi:hypothetical protein